MILEQSAAKSSYRSNLQSVVIEEVRLNPFSAVLAERFKYLSLERQATFRSEFYNGEMFAMAGASRRHNLIAGNTFAAIHRQLVDRDCEVYQGDMRVRISDTR